MSQEVSSILEKARGEVAALEEQKASLAARLGRIDAQLEEPPSDDVETEISRYRDLASEREGVSRAIAGTESKIAIAAKSLKALEEDARKKEYIALVNRLHEDVKPIVADMEELVEKAEPLIDLCLQIHSLDPRLIRMPQNESFYSVEAGPHIVRDLRGALDRIQSTVKNRMPWMPS